MSEWQAHVFCTCFKDGSTSEPPLPRTALEVNRFGVVTLKGSVDHSEDPDELWCWRVGMTVDGSDAPHPCEHDWMKLVDLIFYWPGSFYHEIRQPLVEQLVEDAGLVMLADLIHRKEAPDYPSGGVWASSSEASELLSELITLEKAMPDDAFVGEVRFVSDLKLLLTASESTGNPVICHYNGIIDGAW